MKPKLIANSLIGGFASLTLLYGHNALATDAETLIKDRCLVCHVPTDSGVSRISQQRKTPEGWLMSIGRMQTMHGLNVTDDERRTLVKYLADRQGLAPVETQGARYVMERRLNTPEAFDSKAFTEMCARCHSGARVMLQRRPASEWEHLVHFHLGQFPSLEYQAGSRDRDWLGIALKEMVPFLSRTLPLESDSWKKWQAQAPQKVVGEWSVSGHVTGRGGYSGLMQVSAGKGKDEYLLTLQGRWDDGKPLQGEGRTTLYTNYEWRSHLTVDGTPMRQVLALRDGLLTGRMFERDHDEVGGDFSASLQGHGPSRILAVHPASLKIGQQGELRIVGSGLEGTVTLPRGVKLLKTLHSSPTEVVLQVKAEKTGQGVFPVTVGKASGGQLALYDRIAAVKVQPAFAVARIGGNGSRTEKVQARFDAEAWSAGPDGKLGTKDDYRIGTVPAKWSVEPFDEAAAKDEDVKFAGQMDAATGVFMPGDAGPNPARRMSASNVGNLKVVAEVSDGKKTIRGDGQVIVSAPRWNNPPLP